MLSRWSPGFCTPIHRDGMHGAVVIQKRDPGVVGAHVLSDAAIRHDDDVTDRIVGAALGRVHRAVHLDVVGHRVECPSPPG